MALVGLSVVVGVGVSISPRSISTPSLSPGWPSIVCLIVVVVGCAVARLGHRRVASLSLYACALGLALPAARVTGWMTVSDLFLLLGGALLIPEVSSPRLRSSVQRGFGWAVTLVVIGGLLGTIVAEETQLSLLNLVRVAVAAGATLMIFALWAPSAAQLRRFLMLVVVSGLTTSFWALTHAGSNFGRPSGFSEHPNHLALVSLIAIGPVIAFWLVGGSRLTARIAAGGAAATIVGAIVVSGSRSGLIGLTVAAAVAVVLVRSLATRVQLAMGTAAVAAAGIVGFSALTTENAISRTFNGEAISAAASNQERRAAFSEMADQIRQEPITGVGFSAPLGGHDAYLQLWAAGGVFAFLGGLVVIGSAGRAAACLRRKGPPRSVHERSWPLLASTISLSGLLVALAFQNVLWSRYIWVTVALVAVSSAVAGSERSNGTAGV